MAENGGRLKLAMRIMRSEIIELGGNVVLVPGEEILGASLREAIRLAEEWVQDR